SEDALDDQESQDRRDRGVEELPAQRALASDLAADLRSHGQSPFRILPCLPGSRTPWSGRSWSMGTARPAAPGRALRVRPPAGEALAAEPRGSNVDRGSAPDRCNGRDSSARTEDTPRPGDRSRGGVPRGRSPSSAAPPGSLPFRANGWPSGSPLGPRTRDN